MPLRRTTKKYTKKSRKIVGKRRPYRKRYTRRQRPGTASFPFPRSRICKLRYVDQIDMNPAVGTPANYVFSANGLYDPNISGVGRQPYGFDQLMNLYNHYTVLGAKITVTIANSQDASGMVLSCKLDDNGSIIDGGDRILYLEKPFVRRTIISNSYVKPAKINHFFSARKFFSAKGIRNYNNELSGDAASNPPDQAYFIVMLSPFTGAQDIGTIPAIVEIEYIAKFFEPKELVSS